MRIRLYPDPVLRIKSKEVDKIDDTIKRIINEMKKTMIKEEGIGLAANQVGITKRIIVLDYFDKKIALINPKIIKRFPPYEEAYEGCLSFPELSVKIKRAIEVTVQYMKINGNIIEETLSDIQARAVQHEIDHLDGKLIIDYLESERVLDYNLKIVKGEKNDRA